MCPLDGSNKHNHKGHRENSGMGRISLRQPLSANPFSKLLRLALRLHLRAEERVLDNAAPLRMGEHHRFVVVLNEPLLSDVWIVRSYT